MPKRAAKVVRDQVNIRMSPMGQQILMRLEEHYGTSRTGLFELLLREEARRLGILVGPPPLKTTAHPIKGS
jgi:hypothetical protein